MREFYVFSYYSHFCKNVINNNNRGKNTFHVSFNFFPDSLAFENDSGSTCVAKLGGIEKLTSLAKQP